MLKGYCQFSILIRAIIYWPGLTEHLRAALRHVYITYTPFANLSLLICGQMPISMSNREVDYMTPCCLCVSRSAMWLWWDAQLQSTAQISLDILSKWIPEIFKNPSAAVIHILVHVQFWPLYTVQLVSSFAIWIADTLIHELTLYTYMCIYHQFDSFMHNIVFVHESVNKIIYLCLWKGPSIKLLQ